jgi:hypothetical protein
LTCGFFHCFLNLTFFIKIDYYPIIVTRIGINVNPPYPYFMMATQTTPTIKATAATPKATGQVGELPRAPHANSADSPAVQPTVDIRFARVSARSWVASAGDAG